jgi:hypothetical protein
MRELFGICQGYLTVWCFVSDPRKRCVSCEVFIEGAFRKAVFETLLGKTILKVLV